MDSTETYISKNFDPNNLASTCPDNLIKDCNPGRIGIEDLNIVS